MVSAGCLAVAIGLLDALAKGAAKGTAEVHEAYEEEAFDTEEAAAHISHISPPYLRYISSISPLYLRAEEAALLNPIAPALAPAQTLTLAQ